MPNPHPTVTVEPGVLVRFAGLGIQVSSDYNPDAPGGQPFVTINTEELDSAHTYGEDDGMPAIAVHLNDTTLFDDEGLGNIMRSDTCLPDDLTIYVVRPGDMSEDIAAFRREEDAEAFRSTFENVGDVEHVLACDRELAGQMIAERQPRYSITVKRSDGTDITQELADHPATDGGRTGIDTPGKGIGDLSSLTTNEVLTCLGQIIDQGHEWGQHEEEVDRLHAQASHIIGEAYTLPTSLTTPDGWKITVDHAEAI